MRDCQDAWERLDPAARRRGLAVLVAMVAVNLGMAALRTPEPAAWAITLQALLVPASILAVALSVPGSRRSTLPAALLLTLGLLAGLPLVGAATWSSEISGTTILAAGWLWIFAPYARGRVGELLAACVLLVAAFWIAQLT